MSAWTKRQPFHPNTPGHAFPWLEESAGGSVPRVRCCYWPLYFDALGIGRVRRRRQERFPPDQDAMGCVESWQIPPSALLPRHREVLEGGKRNKTTHETRLH